MAGDCQVVTMGGFHYTGCKTDQLGSDGRVIPAIFCTMRTTWQL